MRQMTHSQVFRGGRTNGLPVVSSGLLRRRREGDGRYSALRSRKRSTLDRPSAKLLSIRRRRRQLSHHSQMDPPNVTRQANSPRIGRETMICEPTAQPAQKTSTIKMIFFPPERIQPQERKIIPLNPKPSPPHKSAPSSQSPAQSHRSAGYQSAKLAHPAEYGSAHKTSPPPDR
jgi:hypothetical protein